jgi:oligoendopeptidase F
MPKKAKRGGAFSHPSVTTSHPYVLLNYTYSLRDVFTIAHELGHAIHQYLSRGVGYINFDTPLTTSETASIFAEMLLFESIKNTLDTDELKSLYSSKLEDIFATLYRQVIFTTFEREIYKNEKELSSDDYSKIWMEQNQKMFGNSVKLTKNYSIWWSYIPHFIHSPFYCYAYAYGQLLVLTLFRLYKNKTPNFNQTYIKFLSSGGSKSPSELIKMFGLDIEDDNFWQLGIDVIKELTQEFEEL